MSWADRWMLRVYVLGLVVAMAASTSWFTLPAAGRFIDGARSALAGSGFGASDWVGAEGPARSAAPPSGAPASGPPATADVSPNPDTPPDAGAPEGPAASPRVGVHFGSLLLAADDGYIWPLRKAKLTTYFAPAGGGTMVLDGGTIHNGLDIALPCWTPIRAAHSGTVLYAGRRAEPFLGLSGSPQPYYDELKRRHLTDRALPIMVVIDDGNGLHSAYAHLARATVSAGDRVAAGDPIGYEGATGNATGCHLHYSLIVADGPWVPVADLLVEKWHYPPFMRLRVDPLLYLPADSPDAPWPRAGLEPPLAPPRYWYDDTPSSVGGVAQPGWR